MLSVIVLDLKLVFIGEAKFFMSEFMCLFTRVWGSHIHMVYICACLGCFFAKFGKAMGGGGYHRQRSQN